MTTSYAELGETCVARPLATASRLTSFGLPSASLRRIPTRAEAVRPTQPKAAQLGIVAFFCCAYTYLKPMTDAGLIEMAIPERPNSSQQVYRLTEKGYAAVA